MNRKQKTKQRKQKLQRIEERGFSEKHLRVTSSRILKLKLNTKEETNGK